MVSTISHMNQLILCVKLLAAILPVAVCFIDGLWFRLPILLIQVISAIQKTQERVLMKCTDTDQRFIYFFILFLLCMWCPAVNKTTAAVWTNNSIVCQEH